MRKKQWAFSTAEEESVEKNAEKMSISPFLSRVLINRGFRNKNEINKFLYPTLSYLYDPYLMTGMKIAVDRIARAITLKEKIIIFGDYDADGITGTAVLKLYLMQLNANVDHFIPDRMEEGYGLNVDDIDRMHHDGGKLIVTVDCGISNSIEVDYANSIGVDVVVTDHHKVPEDVPRAVAVLNPKQKNCYYPCKMLAGIGVVFKLIHALNLYYKMESEKFLKYLDLVAFGTVADMVPLIDENRIISFYGLKTINSTKNLGLRALFQEIGLGGITITSKHISYNIAPKINAAGRIGDPDLAIELLTAKTMKKTTEISRFLIKQNIYRQEIERSVLQSVYLKLNNNKDLIEKDIIVLASDQWHAGVIGIVASLIKEKYYKPTILIVMENEVSRGSGRGIEGYSLYAILKNMNQDLLLKYGGHDVAIGFSLRTSDVPAFKEEIQRVAAEIWQDNDYKQVIPVDTDIDFNAITNEFLEELELLKPFGPENRPPIFVTRGCSVVSSHIIGNGRHLKLKLRQGKKCYDAIGFNMAKYRELMRDSNQLVNICYEIDFLNFSLRDYVQLRLKDIELPSNESTGAKTIDFDDLEDDVPDKLQYQIEIFKRMGNNYYFNQEYESAILEYDKALQIKPDNAEILYHMGLVYKQLGDDETAFGFFNQAIDAAPKSGARGRKSAKKAQEMLKFMGKMNKSYA